MEDGYRLNMKYQLAIIGGGAAGVTSAVYASRKKLKTVLITKDFIGQTGRAGVIENYPGENLIDGIVLAKRFEKHARLLPITIMEGERVCKIRKKRSLFIIEAGTVLEAESIIIASGRNPRPLKVCGEDKFFDKGVFYSTRKNEHLFDGKSVAVIGGGDAGFKTAVRLSENCLKVYLLEVFQNIKAEEVSVERARNAKNINIILGARLKEIKGGVAVESIVYIKEGKEHSLSIDGVFIEVGSDPASSFAKDLVDLNERGEIKVNPISGETKTEGLFAAGDVTDARDKQITVACGDGVRALISAYNYIQSKKI